MIIDGCSSGVSILAVIKQLHRCRRNRNASEFWLGKGSKNPTPPLMDKKNKKTCWFFGLFSSFGTKQFFENFSPWKFLNPHIYGQIFLIVGFLGWFFLLWTLIPQNSTQKTNNQESDLVSSQLSWQFSYAGLWSWEKIKPAKLAFDNI